MTSVALAVAPIAWKNDDLPDLGRDTSLEQVWRESREAGFTGTEKGGSYPNDPKGLKTSLDAHGLTLASGWYSGELLLYSVDEEYDRMAKHMEVLLTCGSPVCVYAETSNSTQTKLDVALKDRPVMTEDQIKAYGEKLTMLARKMEAAGLPMAYHHHMGTIIEKEAELDLLMTNSGDEAGLVFDTGHLVFGGSSQDEMVAAMRRHMSRINHIHVKDVRADIAKRVWAEEMAFLDAVFAGVFTVPGDGVINYQPVADLIKEFDFNGWVVVEAEQDPSKANPLEYSRLGFETISACLSNAGVDVRS
ncbi:MAG: myo-inosose-2 dehydratase [Alphaproteobacteria bacterium]